MIKNDKYSVCSKFKMNEKEYTYYSLKDFENKGFAKMANLPFSIKVLLEAAIRQYDGKNITEAHIMQLATWAENKNSDKEVPFIPSRIILQDFTGVPAVVDLASMRKAMVDVGGNPEKINPLIPVDLVIDHSIMVDKAGTNSALEYNIDLEFERNSERYKFLRWAQDSFNNFRAIPPATGIIHQVNLEYLADVVQTKEIEGQLLLFPDSLVGTDSHSTMINGLGVVGWGVGGIEAEAGMLGQPLYFVTPEVVGFKLSGKLNEGVTATDLALTVVEILRKKGVVGKFVEFYGDGLSEISLADRATIANMAPEYGATMGYFPVDDETINYLRITGRNESLIKLIEAYYREQGLYRVDGMEAPIYTDIIELDISTVVSCLAGPKRPQDRTELKNMKVAWEEVIRKPLNQGGLGLTDEKINKSINIGIDSEKEISLKTGSVVIAALTSCTNTSNPSVMIGAGLVARKACELGLKKPSYVKSSLTPGSRVVTDYLRNANLLGYLEDLGFNVVGYGCATCIGNSGPLSDEVSKAIEENDLTVVSVISGNRNFEGRVHPLVKANYLASPLLVVAYALAGRIDIDFESEPIGYNSKNQPVYLKDIWPSNIEIQEMIVKSLDSKIFTDQYSNVDKANELWNKIDTPKGRLYDWDEDSTYIQNPPFFDELSPEVGNIENIKGAKVLALLGDSVTTDHISPAGNIKADSPAGKYLIENGVEAKDFNSYGSRRGNHQVMMRGTFANIRIRNQLVPGIEGGMTKYTPTGEVMSIYDAAMKYKLDGTPLIIMAGKEYGTGSSRDWAAKGTRLLGVKAVIAESYERIHRSNLVGMGILPLQFIEGINWASFNIDGTEKFDIVGLDNNIKAGQIIMVEGLRSDGTHFEFETVLRLDSVVDIEYYRNGGILQTVLRQFKA
ncbi:MAG: aconitate hydratase AcnA [Vulcanibacillus sp.]